MRGLFRDQSGALSLNFVLLLPVFIIAVGSAVDFSRAFAAREQLQNAVDAATLAATRMLALQPGSTDDDLRRVVQAHIDSSEVARDDLLTCGAPRIAADRTDVAVSVDIDCSVATIFPIGVGEFEFTRSATSDFTFDELDVAFMLDVSGSMGGRKLRDLKSAVRTALDIFLNESRGDVRIAFAPYSTALDAGPFAEAATGQAAGHSCVTERTQDAFTDAPPTEELLQRRERNCNRSQILPLTDDFNRLDDAIDDLYASGWTAGHLGIAWAWYLVSPRWAEFWPADSAPRSNPTTRRAVVIMTDGMFNREYQRNQNGRSTRQSERLCESMRDEGILVFSIGFRAPNGVKPTLRNCATIPTYFFDSNSAEALENAYRSIAEELVSHTMTR